MPLPSNERDVVFFRKSAEAAKPPGYSASPKRRRKAASG